MPICIPKELPAFQTLANENIFVMDNDRASHQDIRPLRVLLLNLMPKKIETECQFLRLLSADSSQCGIFTGFQPRQQEHQQNASGRLLSYVCRNPERIL